MRGNRLARGGDPTKTRSQRRRERQEKIAKTNRAQRQKKRISRFVARRCIKEEDQHMTAIMQSYAIRRKAERQAERVEENLKEEQQKQQNKAQAGEQVADSNFRTMTKGRPGSRGREKMQTRNTWAAKCRQPKVMTRSLY